MLTFGTVDDEVHPAAPVHAMPKHTPAAARRALQPRPRDRVPAIIPPSVMFMF